MKTLLLAIACILLTTLPLFAQQSEQSGLVKTADGYLVVWNEPGNCYTIEVRGKNVKSVPDRQLWFTVDGKFFQIVTPAISNFSKAVGTSRLDDRSILTAHRDWESNYIGDTLKSRLNVESTWQKLSNGNDALFWSFDMPIVAEKQTAKRQLYLAVVKHDNVLALNTVVEGNDDEKILQKLLLDTMNTLKPSDKPLSLEKASEMVKGN